MIHVYSRQVVLGAPECQSYTFDADGKVTSFTGAAQRVARWLQPKLVWHTVADAQGERIV